MVQDIHDCLIIGAGASGLIAAAELGRQGTRTVVVEGQDRPARKLLITGGGRCNITNVNITEKDLHGSCARLNRHVLRTFPPDQAIAFFEGLGVPLKEEDAGRYFTADGRAGQVVDALMNAAVGAGSQVLCGQRVREVTRDGDLFVVTTTEKVLRSRMLLVATGGLSYPATGSDGFGFKVAKKFGHTVIPTGPGLVPLLSGDKSYAGLAGLTLDVGLSLWSGGKKIAQHKGSFLFTHVGFSGPVVLDMSRDWQQAPADRILWADLAPDVSMDQLEGILKDDTHRQNVFTRLSGVVPKRLAGFLVERSKADRERPAHLVSREERKRVTACVKEHALPVLGSAGYEKAEITFGGVDLKEIKDASLESRLCPGLFFAGEVLDVDGPVGGYNLQWAWASGVAAARGIARRREE